MSAGSATAERLAALRAEVKKIEGLGSAGGAGFMPLGIDSVDSRIAGGGLAVHALHEVAAASAHMADDAAATLFLAALAGRKLRSGGAGAAPGKPAPGGGAGPGKPAPGGGAGPGKPALDGGASPGKPAPGGDVLWALARRDLFAPGLAQAGLPPDRLLYAECRNDEEVLAVMEEGLRHGGLAAIVGEVGRCAMAAGRRLQLAAEEGGTMALMLRRWKKAGRDPLAEPSPAVTRWRVGCAPSAPLPVAGIGRACWHVDLARQRGGEPQHWILEAPDAEARLALFPPSGDRADRASRRAA